MESNFSELAGERFAEALLKLGIESPTRIQREAIPLICGGTDVIACSETGTGKTLAYMLPIFKSIDIENKNPQCLVLAPTHELASQVYRQFTLFNSELGTEYCVETALVIGGANIQRQLEALKRKPRIIIGSSGRVLELNSMKKLSLHFVKKIILDEGDRLLEDAFLDEIKKIVKATLKDRRIAFFSATLDDKIKNRALGLVPGATVVDTRHNRIPKSIEHAYIICEKRTKLETLRKLLRSNGIGRAVVFVNSPYHINSVYDRLNFHGINCLPLYGAAKKTERKLAIESFREGKTDVLIASDIAARGIDIPGVDCIVNFDFPEMPDAYVHRAGRTGRMGVPGICISLITKGEKVRAMQFEKEFAVTFKEKTVAYGKLEEQ